MYQHIERLLAFHDYVVVPGLGGFMLQHQSAVLSSHKIMAPCMTISFNPLMQYADGLLAIEIARHEGITYRAAVEIIESGVGQMQLTLRSMKYLNMGQLGVLELDAQAALVFTPPSDLSFIPSNFGLNDLMLRQSKTQVPEKPGNITFRLPSFRTLRYTAAAVLVFALLLISPSLNDHNKTDLAGFVTLSFLNDTSAEISSFNNSSESIAIVDSINNPCPELVETVLETAEVINNDNDLYHVIVASLPTASSAENYCELLKADNFECAHVLAPIKSYRVALKSFEDRQEAIDFMEELRRTDERFETAWVLCK